MTLEFIFAGAGGQGVMSMGMVLAGAALREGRQVSWLPSYGPEQRGGTANCMVVVSDEPVASPLVVEPDVLVVMNQPSLERFGAAVRPGGLLFVNRDLVPGAPGRADVRVHSLDVLGAARELGEARVANMVMLGAVLRVTGAASLASAAAALPWALPPRYHHLLPVNRMALELGAQLVAAAADAPASAV